LISHTKFLILARRVELPNDRIDTYVSAIQKNLKDDKAIQLVVIIFPTLRDDRYAAVKRVLCSDLPCPSQCINAKTLRNEAKNRSIVQKILLQINRKLGGSLWGLNIPPYLLIKAKRKQKCVLVSLRTFLQH
jgi:aubergine